MEKIRITQLPEKPLINEIKTFHPVNSKFIKIGAVILVVFGVITGYLLSGNRMIAPKNDTGTTIGASGGKKTVGSTDSKEFPDTTEGILEAGGINGEGTHKLIRPGGVSQTVYLTSSILDLNLFVGKKVKIWGKTFAANKAGWLMDVGKLETLE